MLASAFTKSPREMFSVGSKLPLPLPPKMPYPTARSTSLKNQSSLVKSVKMAPLESTVAMASPLFCPSRMDTAR